MLGDGAATDVSIGGPIVAKYAASCERFVGAIQVLADDRYPLEHDAGDVLLADSSLCGRLAGGHRAACHDVVATHGSLAGLEPQSWSPSQDDAERFCSVHGLAASASDVLLGDDGDLLIDDWLLEGALGGDKARGRSGVHTQTLDSLDDADDAGHAAGAAPKKLLGILPVPDVSKFLKGGGDDDDDDEIDAEDIAKFQSQLSSVSPTRSLAGGNQKKITDHFSMQRIHVSDKKFDHMLQLTNMKSIGAMMDSATQFQGNLIQQQITSGLKDADDMQDFDDADTDGTGDGGALGRGGLNSGRGIPMRDPDASGILMPILASGLLND